MTETGRLCITLVLQHPTMKASDNGLAPAGPSRLV